MNLGPFTVQATGVAGIYTDAHPGLVLRLARLARRQRLRHHQDQRQRRAAAEHDRHRPQPRRRARSARSRSGSQLTGEIKILEVIKLNASFLIQVGGGQVTVGRGDTLRDVQPRTERLGDRRPRVGRLLRPRDDERRRLVQLEGPLRHPAQRRARRSARAASASSATSASASSCARSPSAGLPAGVRDRCSTRSASAFSAEVSARLFGITFASIGLSGSVGARGLRHRRPDRAGDGADQDPLRHGHKTVSFKIGTVTLPRHDLPGGQRRLGSDERRPGFDDWARRRGHGGDLYLNMGDRALPRAGIFPGRGVADGGGVPPRSTISTRSSSSSTSPATRPRPTARPSA